MWQPPDHLLRNRVQYFAAVAEGSGLERVTAGLAMNTVVAMALYGFCIGVNVGGRQIGFDTVKFPLLLLGTLALCVSLLYVCNTLLGARLSFRQTLTVVLCALSVTATLLASLAPVLWFLTWNAPDRAAIAAMNSIAFTVAGICGWRFALDAATHAYAGRTSLVRAFRAWMFVYGAVGAQLAWLLRPYFSQSDAFFSPVATEGNVFVSLARLLLRWWPW